MIAKAFTPEMGIKVFAIMNHRNLPLLLWRMLPASASAGQHVTVSASSRLPTRADRNQ